MVTQLFLRSVAGEGGGEALCVVAAFSRVCRCTAWDWSSRQVLDVAAIWQALGRSHDDQRTIFRVLCDHADAEAALIVGDTPLGQRARRGGDPGGECHRPGCWRSPAEDIRGERASSAMLMALSSKGFWRNEARALMVVGWASGELKNGDGGDYLRELRFLLFQNEVRRGREA